jgi:hypothetical protein
MQTFVVYGSWKVRHNEPIEPPQDALILQAIPPYQRAATTVRLDKARELQLNGATVLAASGAASAADQLPDGYIPLALVEQADAGYAITHLATIVDLWSAQFMRAPETQPSPDAPLWQRIYDLYDEHHHIYSTHERYFTKARETTELEQKLHFSSHASYVRLVQQIYEALDNGEIAGFYPKYTQEFQCWSYDNYLYEILPNERGDSGYVSILQYCTRKPAWNAPMMMYKKKVYNEDSLERWEKNYKNKWVERDKQELLEEYFGYPIRELPTWRRSRCDVGVESVVNGNIFMINVDDCRIHQAPDALHALQQCEIEYLKTRGEPSLAAIYNDFWSLVEQISQLFRRLGIEPSATNYSKLTWLRDVESQL